MNPKRARGVHAPRMPAPGLDHPPVPRLARLGASQAVMIEVERRWAALSLPERRESAAAIAALTDEELGAMLREQEEEMADG